MSRVALVLAELEEARKAVRAVEGKQIFSKSVQDRLHALAGLYFANVGSQLSAPSKTQSATELEKIFSELHVLSRKHASKQKCLTLLKNAKGLLVTLEGAALAQAANRSAGARTATDDLIISTLIDVCQPAALAYRQALSDLASTDRDSWRGPATDLREALRETLDVLAPDNDVEGMPGYKPEQDAKRPTMKQKVRYILKSRGLVSGQIATPESALQGIEEMVGGLTRTVYTRSSVSTHTPTTRGEVLRVHSWVRLVLCELLELPV